MKQIGWRYLIHQTKLTENSITNHLNVPWEELPENLKESNRNQADHIGIMLRAIGCSIVPLTEGDAESFNFTTEEIEIMAEMEHKRWVDERLSSGWKFNSKKNLKDKTSPYMIPWKQLTNEIKESNWIFIRKLPAFLAQSGFQIIHL